MQAAEGRAGSHGRGRHDWSLPWLETGQIHPSQEAHRGARFAHDQADPCQPSFLLCARGKGEVGFETVSSTCNKTVAFVGCEEHKQFTVQMLMMCSASLATHFHNYKANESNTQTQETVVVSVCVQVKVQARTLCLVNWELLDHHSNQSKLFQSSKSLSAQGGGGTEKSTVFEVYLKACSQIIAARLMSFSVRSCSVRHTQNKTQAAPSTSEKSGQ